LGLQAVIVKLGDQGCYYCDAGTETHSPGFQVTAKDTTAAGDTFNAALAVGLCEEMTMPQALRFANAAAALSVTRQGAQSSAPTRKDVDQLL
jgi:ribokinase